MAREATPEQLDLIADLVVAMAAHSAARDLVVASMRDVNAIIARFDLAARIFPGDVLRELQAGAASAERDSESGLALAFVVRMIAERIGADVESAALRYAAAHHIDLGDDA